jgi:hypothetical protein
MTLVPPDGHPAHFESSPDPDFARTLIQAMDNFADNAHAPAFDGTAILRRTRRRRGLAVVAAAAAAVALTTGTAFALHPSHQPTSQNTAAAASTAAAHTPSSAPTDVSPSVGASSGNPSPAPETTAGSGHATVPETSGMPQSRAEKTLLAAGLRIQAVHNLTDWNTPAGAVIGTDPRPGTTVTPGTPITLFISKGKP